ncbi:hypothetical protein HYQ46_004238 [Verticillium longisporum]|nr:hypothetical protein HYQ46_004238 [Verticillium longisporum]
MLTNVALVLATLPLIHAANFTRSVFIYHRQEEECDTKHDFQMPEEWYENTRSSHSGEAFASRYFNNETTWLSNWEDDETVKGQATVILPDKNIHAVRHACIGLVHGLIPDSHRESQTFCTTRRVPPTSPHKDFEESPVNDILADVIVHHSVNPTRVKHPRESDGLTHKAGPEEGVSWAECIPKGKGVKEACSVAGRVLAGQVLKAFEGVIKTDYEKPQLTISIGPFNAIPSFFHLARLDTSSPEAEKIITRATSVAFELVEEAEDPAVGNHEDVFVHFYTHSKLDGFKEHFLGPDDRGLRYKKFSAEYKPTAITSRKEWCRACNNDSKECKESGADKNLGNKACVSAILISTMVGLIALFSV